MKFLKLALCGIFFMPLGAYAQKEIRGSVFDGSVKSKTPIPGAIVGWVGTTTTALTNLDGEFTLIRPVGATALYAAFLGFKSDTIVVGKAKKVTFNLKIGGEKLDEVVVRDNQSASAIKAKEAQLTELISARELTKAACCNLSESFETNPAIDASFTDAVTGTRQIKLLGLDGPYSYYTRGNIPTLGGISSVLGLQLIPGNWIQSIQLTKGSGSVINGFESIAGQVNYEIRQPDANEKLFGQLYANAMGRLEQSLVYNQILNHNWSTNLFLYARQQVGKPDWNKDGFLDMPQGNMYIGQNTWKFQGESGLETKFGFKIAYNQQTGGQMEALNSNPPDSVWRANMQAKRFEYWHKMGFVFQDAVARSIGFQFSYTHHNQIADFGLPNSSTYSGIENAVYANLIYQDILGNTNHNYKLGACFKYQQIDEVYKQNPFNREEIIPGIFAEYTYLYLDQLSVVGGLRLDGHNYYGAFITPRLHIRYAPVKNHTLRFNVGKAFRTPNVFADNIGSMASNRTWQMAQTDADLPYFGLKQEESINTGLSYTYTFDLDYRPGSIRAEYFYTAFNNQLVKDWDAGTNVLNYYNLSGQSFAHSAQFQIDYEVLQRLELRMAYRFVDAKTEYQSIGLAENPFIAKHRFFVNVGYETKNAWKFDATYNWLSAQRLPSTASSPVEYQRDDYSPDFGRVNMQITKVFKSQFEVHVGVENIFDVKQDNPIVSVDSPFSSYFDATMIWGPIMGRAIYAGIRLNLLGNK